MKSLIWMAFISCTCIFISCDNNTSGGRPVQLKSLDLPSRETQKITTDSISQNMNNGNMTATPTTPVAVSPTAKNLNPAHGQPGHRCDIPVGSPLDSKPTIGTTITQPAATNTNPINMQPPVPVGSKAGLNPAHGQPGHRCDIAVGAPLDSKPAATTTFTPSPVNPGNKN